MKSGSTRKTAGNLVALGSAAVLTVYAAGYMKTRAAAERLKNAGHRDIAGPPGLRAPAPDVVRPPIADGAPRAEPAPTPAVVAVPAQRKPVPSEPPARTVSAQHAPAATATPAAPTVAVPAPAPHVELAAAPASAPVATPQAPVTPPAATPAVPTAAVPPATPPASTVPPDPDPKTAEPPAPKPSPYKDGTYYGWGTSRHGSIQAGVTIEGGKIAASWIAQCLTRYSCSWIAHLVPQVVSRQSANVDYVSGATQSTYAFYDAVVEALSKAR